MTPPPANGPSDASAPEKRPNSGSKYLPTLDGWRAIAILLVLVCHSSDGIRNALQAVHVPVSVEPLRRLGLLGVQIFFGLSGLLITSRLLEDEQRRGRISLKSFYLRRSFRILPAAFVFLGTVGALSLAGLLSITLGRWLSAVFCFANYSQATSSWYVAHFWSLAIEEHFYLLWPTAFLLLGSVRRRAVAVVLGALIVALWRAVEFKFRVTPLPIDLFWGRTDISADCLLWGVAVALVLADPEWGARLRRFVSAPGVWFGLVAIVLGVQAFPSGKDWKLVLLLATLKNVAIPLMLLGTLLRAEGILGRVLESGPFRWLGRLSYSLYLWQQLFLAWQEERVPTLGLLQSFPLGIAAALVCASLSHYLVEKPMIGLGHRLSEVRDWRVPQAA